VLYRQGVSYFEQEITVDLFDQSQWKSSGVDTPLVYQSLIDDGVLFHAGVGADDRCVMNVKGKW